MNHSISASDLFKMGQDEAGALAPLSTPCASKEDDPAVQASWLLRMRTRDEELKRYFELPDNESLLEDFHCALRKRILLQGRIYVFTSYVCFYSNVMGFVRKRVIHLKDVVNVRKKTNFRFPNSIELEFRNPDVVAHPCKRRDFYTSFLSRDEAFTLIHNAWLQCRPADDPGAASGSCRRTTSSLRRAVSHDSAIMLDSNSDGKMLEAGLGRSATDGLDAGLGGCSSDEAGKSHSYETDDGRSDCDEEEEEEEEEEAALVWEEVANGTPPPVPKSCRLLANVELPCSVRDFFDRIMSNDAHFFEDFHASQGDRRITLTTWRAHEQMGHVRELQFVSPIKSAFANWGTTHTQCHQTQRYVVYSGQQVLFESSQVMTDIPYGDCFSVDTRWDVTPNASDPSHCLIKLYMHCVFTKKCLFRAVIDSGSFKQSHDTYQIFFQQVKHVVTKPKPLTPINIRDRSFHNAPQSRPNSAPSTPKGAGDRPSVSGSPCHLQRPPSVLFSGSTPPNTRGEPGAQGQGQPGDTCCTRDAPAAPRPLLHPSISRAGLAAATSAAAAPQDPSCSSGGAGGGKDLGDAAMGPGGSRPSLVAGALQLPPRSQTGSAGREALLLRGDKLGRANTVPARGGHGEYDGGVRSSDAMDPHASPRTPPPTPWLPAIIALQLLMLALMMWHILSAPAGPASPAAQSAADPTAASTPAAQRLLALQQEVNLLQLRVNLVNRELGSLLQHMGEQAAAGAAGAVVAAAAAAQ